MFLCTGLIQIVIFIQIMNFTEIISHYGHPAVHGADIHS